VGQVLVLLSPVAIGDDYFRDLLNRGDYSRHYSDDVAVRGTDQRYRGREAAKNLIEGIHAFGEIKVRNTFMGETHAVAEAEFVRKDGISVPYSVIYDVAENSLKGSNMSGPAELKLRQTQTFYEGGDSSSVSSPSGAPQLNGSHSRRCRHHRRTAAIW
jgi:hypothetical protein